MVTITCRVISAMLVPGPKPRVTCRDSVTQMSSDHWIVGTAWARMASSGFQCLATPVAHIARVLIERSSTALPRRVVGAGVEQIAGNIDLLAFGSVGQTLHWRLRGGMGGGAGSHR